MVQTFKAKSLRYHITLLLRPSERVWRSKQHCNFNTSHSAGTALLAELDAQGWDGAMKKLLGLSESAYFR